jgi:hydroxyethylthiazole kinase-like sugar kinase family protein
MVWSGHERPGLCGSHSLMTTVQANACRPIILDPVGPGARFARLVRSNQLNRRTCSPT